ncbi:unnamed protein product [Larinioides sclopetarius]|uniref:Uncharacterized protein n=1 Tax=Larinioides sclopetarius TaxID=280406 RepID=A0AAV2BCE4_9ARAC
MVAVSYKSPKDFIDIVQVEDRGDITLIKLRNAIKSYSHFKMISKINYDECISMSLVKFYTQDINRSSDNDFDEFFEEIYSKELKNYTEVEKILKQLKYLCDPNGSEIVKYLCQMSSTDSLEISMANLNICDKYASPESKEERLKVKRNSDSAVTFYRKKEDNNEILYDSKKKECEWKRIEEANKNKIILNEKMSSVEDDAEKKNKIQNDVNNKQDEWKVEDTKRNTSPSRQINPRKNTEKRSSDESQNDTKEQDKQKSATIPAAEKHSKKNSNKIWIEKSNNQDECKTIKRKQRSKTTRISFSKRRVKKENSNKNHHDIGHEQGELKDGQMSSTGKNAEEENKYRNSIQKESVELENFLRMLLVLGDKQGMSYVMKTS